MELLDYHPTQDRFWSESKIDEPFNYAIIVKPTYLPKAVNAFVTIYCGFDSKVWTYRKQWKIGDIDLIFVHDLDWQALAKLHGLNMHEFITGIMQHKRIWDMI